MTGSMDDGLKKIKATGVLLLAPQDTTESWSSLLERRLETSVLRSADLSGIRQMSEALSEFQVSLNLHQDPLQWHLHFRFLFRL
jgi:hypothetical protein